MLKNSLSGVTVLVAHESGDKASVIQHAVREAGAHIVYKAEDVVQAIERVRQQTSLLRALVFSHSLSGDTCALIDVAAEHKVRIVIVYPAGSNPTFPFNDSQCLIAPYTGWQVVAALAQALAEARGCMHWSTNTLQRHEKSVHLHQS